LGLALGWGGLGLGLRPQGGQLPQGPRGQGSPSSRPTP
jgi:hypothetical protein